MCTEGPSGQPRVTMPDKREGLLGEPRGKGQGCHCPAEEGAEPRPLMDHLSQTVESGDSTIGSLGTAFVSLCCKT